MVVSFGMGRASVVLRRRRSVAFGRNDHELGDRIAREREVEAELERIGQTGLVVVAGHLSENGDAARVM